MSIARLKLSKLSHSPSAGLQWKRDYSTIPVVYAKELGSDMIRQLLRASAYILLQAHAYTKTNKKWFTL